MFFKKKNYKYIYIFNLILFTFLTIFSTTNVLSKIYKIEDINVNEPYNLSFQKNNVIEKAFNNAFNELLRKITFSRDFENLKKIETKEVKELVDSFIIVDEKFINNKYYAKFEVDFNKNKIFKFLNNRRITSSIPLRKKIFILPILIDISKDQILMFSENAFYKKWKNDKKNYFLIDYILPNEDLDDFEIIKKKTKDIENYEFKEIIKKYDVKDYIILLIFKDKNNIKVLSKINLNQNKKIITNLYNEVNLKNPSKVKETILDLKQIYEDEWKKINVINQSIKISIKVKIDSKSTNIDSALTALDSLENNLLILGGREKHGGLKGIEKKKHKIIRAYTFGEAKKKFNDYLRKNSIESSYFSNLETAFNSAIKDALKLKIKVNILFSPACSSYDQFKNFSERGKYFKNLVYKKIK